MAFSDYEHCHYCVADREAGRGLPERHGYKGLYVGDVEVPDHINVICSHHLRVLKDEIATLRDREAQHLARIAELETVYESYREARARIAQLEEANVLLQRAYSLACNERNALTESDAQHLADIMALREALSQGYALSLNAREQVLKATAHYDDAKAAEGGAR